MQNAAGTFAYLLESAMPPLLASLAHPLTANDLSVPVIKSLEYLMLAQAQECYWQKAVMGKNPQSPDRNLDLFFRRFVAKRHYRPIIDAGTYPIRLPHIQSSHDFDARSLPSTRWHIRLFNRLLLRWEPYFHRYVHIAYPVPISFA